MGAEEEGTVEIWKKDKKSKEKSSKRNKNEVNNGEIYDFENGGKYGIIKDCKNEEKKVGERGDNEKKKKKKKKAKNEVGEDGGDGYGKGEKGNDDGMAFEVGGGIKDDGNVTEKVERKKRKREKDNSEQLKEHEFDGAKGGSQTNVNEACFHEMQNGKEVEAAVGWATDGDVVSKVEKKRKKKKQKMGFDSGGLLQDNTPLTEYETQENEDHRGKVIKLEAFGEDNKPDSIEKPEKKKKKNKRGKKKDNDDLDATGQDNVAEEHTKSNANSIMNEELERDLRNGVQGKRKNAKLGDNGFEDPNSKKSKKKVRFSGNVEVFRSSDDKLVRGKRFSKEEDEIVKQAVFKYIEEHCLGEKGLNMVLNCKSHPEIKNCWKDIATSLPHRPHSSIYYRAQVLFRRGEKRKWTEDEIELLRKSHKAHGNQWKDLAEELGKHRVHVKDTWRRIRHENLKKGQWSQEEYQALFDLVNIDLRMRYSEEKKSKYGMLRDNIAWTAISDKLLTRAEANCCLKWYNQLTSSMVAEGIWADADDYRLIDALFQLDASCIEDVDWDNLLDHRSGDVCRKRWNQMVRHIGHSWNKSFADQVEVLANRYCPDLLEAREVWDSKPIVP